MARLYRRDWLAERYACIVSSPSDSPKEDLVSVLRITMPLAAGLFRVHHFAVQARGRERTGG